ncbi:MAG: GNAT family N-acetyltransferase [Armatimonadota bacterium]
MTGRLIIREFGPETEADAVALINAYIDGWPYCRPIDGPLLAHWRTLGSLLQPRHMLLAYADGVPRAFLHGELRPNYGFIHLLATAPGAVEEGTRLVREFEARAALTGKRELSGPSWSAALFYAGYILGREPCQPHWATDTTQVFVRNGYRIGTPAVLMKADLAREVELEPLPAGYRLDEVEFPAEFDAQPFCYIARYQGEQVALAGARIYPHQASPDGGIIGQVGHVNTQDAHRCQGLARILTKHCLHRLREMGAAESLLATSLDNFPALAAYERAGFVRWEMMPVWSKT